MFWHVKLNMNIIFSSGLMVCSKIGPFFVPLEDRDHHSWHVFWDTVYIHCCGLCHCTLIMWWYVADCHTAAVSHVKSCHPPAVSLLPVNASTAVSFYPTILATASSTAHQLHCQFVSSAGQVQQLVDVLRMSSVGPSLLLTSTDSNYSQCQSNTVSLLPAGCSVNSLLHCDSRLIGCQCCVYQTDAPMTDVVCLQSPPLATH